MTSLKKDLYELTEQISSLSTKTDRLINRLDTLLVTPRVKTTSFRGRGKRKKISPEVLRVQKYVKPQTDSEKVVQIIKKSKKGIDKNTLMKKTGFDSKKISNILHRSYKKGLIERIAKGIYIGSKN